MYKVSIITKLSSNPCELKTESRNLARSVKLVCKENGLPCEVQVVVPASTKKVKFKDID